MNLAHVLQGEVHGVFRWSGRGGPERDVEPVAVEAGWRYVPLDTAAATDRDGFLEACADAFDLPVAAVTSWEVLDGCLRGLDLDDPDGLLVVWTGWHVLADVDPDAFDVALEVFRDACVAWHDDDVPGAVLLVGDGPDTDLPDL